MPNAHTAMRKRKREIVTAFRNEAGCGECGERHPAVLDLHHPEGVTPHFRLTPRRADGTSKRGGYQWHRLSYEDLATELQRCVVLCSNCHRILTWRARQAREQGE